MIDMKIVILFGIVEFLETIVLVVTEGANLKYFKESLPTCIKYANTIRLLKL